MAELPCWQRAWTLCTPTRDTKPCLLCQPELTVLQASLEAQSSADQSAGAALWLRQLQAHHRADSQCAGCWRGHRAAGKVQDRHRLLLGCAVGVSWLLLSAAGHHLAQQECHSPGAGWGVAEEQAGQGQARCQGEDHVGMMFSLAACHTVWLTSLKPQPDMHLLLPSVNAQVGAVSADNGDTFCAARGRVRVSLHCQ